MDNFDKEAEVAFERCIDLLASMVELYGAEVLKDIEDSEKNNNDECIA